MSWKLLGLVGVIGGSAGCMDMNLSFGPGVQGSGKAGSETRDVSSFEKIEMRGAYDVEVKVGDKQHVEISGDDNLLKLVETSVKDGTLILSTKENVHPKTKLKVLISAPNLQAFSLKGAGDVNIQGVHEDNFTIDLRGAGDLTASGEAKKLDVTLKGAGDLKLYDLRAESASVDLSGAGDVNVYASKFLKAKVSGVGDLSYKGHPATVEKTKSGVGDINDAD